jgi:precorrin-3B synthase
LHAQVSARAGAPRDPGAVDACPGVLRVHEAADGHLARVRVPGGRVDARALRALAQAAGLGNDIVELTSRAGVQVRGLGQDAGEELARLLSSGGLLPWPEHERVRNIVAPPLGGRDPASVAAVDEVVAALDVGLCADRALAGLPGRFLFAVDDGTSALDGLRADVGVVAERDGAGAVFRVHLDGVATTVTAPPTHAHEAALEAAHAFLDLRARDGDGAWRVRELEGGAARVAGQLGASLVAVRPADAAWPGDSHDHGGADPSGPRRSAGQHVVAGQRRLANPRRLGVRVQRDGLFALSALPPLARLNGAQLERLAELAEGDVRVSPWRTLTFVDVDASELARLAVELERVGLVTASDSGWVGLSACAGLGACARARLDVRGRAARRASERDERSPTEHWSACERRCGEPPDVGVSAVAGEHGVELTMAGVPA